MILGSVMIWSALGILELPPMLRFTKDGTGDVNKFVWAGENMFGGMSEAGVLIMVGVCKVLAFIDMFSWGASNA